MAPDQFVFFAAGVVGFGPAIAILYHGLRTYDYPFTAHAFFDTRRVFLGLAVGMVLGTISGAITVGLRVAIADLVSLVVVLILLAAFEEAFKLVYLNRKGYRGRFDTTFYGLSLGVGIAAIAAAGNAYTNGPDLFLPSVALPIFAFSVSLALVHSATGAIIGYGCSKGDVVVGFAKALTGRVLHAALLVPFFIWYSIPSVTIALPAFSLGAGIAFALFLYRYAYRTLLPETLPAELRRERRRRARAGTKPE
ncbi:MAG TPA: hypothetical protein VGR51_02225 [Thermoplasmata archaeon]|nr:hypothetical protein [Thermoplasmata archaeon]